MLPQNVDGTKDVNKIEYRSSGMYIYVILGSGRHRVHKNTKCNSDTRSRKSRKCSSCRGPTWFPARSAKDSCKSSMNPFHILLSPVYICSIQGTKTEVAIARRGTT